MEFKLDILCKNCYKCIKFDDIENHTEMCYIPYKEIDDNENEYYEENDSRENDLQKNDSRDDVSRKCYNFLRRGPKTS